jgi:NADPH-dependent curcumin reductase
VRKAGETLVITAAAGSIGSLVGQIGKRLGLKVIGIAGTRRKCDWIVHDLGFDGAIDYRSEDVGARLDALCPQGVDILFENVGGDVMDLVIDRIRMNARVALCGLVSTYNGARHRGGGTMMQLINRRGRIQGFIALDFFPLYSETMQILEPWILDGSLKYQVDVLKELDSAPQALNRVFRGDNHGIQLVQVTTP